MPKPLIRVIGSLNIDFTTVTPRHPSPGETLIAKSHSINPGGKGANQAAACGRASVTRRPADTAASTSSPVQEDGSLEQDVLVEMVGAVGANDPYWASMLQPKLVESGVQTGGVREVEGVGGTGTATIIVDEGQGGENRILVVSGANSGGMQAEDPEVRRRIFGQRDAEEKSLPDVVVLQGEIPRETVMQTIHGMGQKEVEVVFNPAPVFPEGIDEEVWKDIGTLIVNESEMEMLAEQSGYKLPGDVERFGWEHLDAVARLLVGKGVKTVVVTLGAKGAYYHDNIHREGLVHGVQLAKEKVVDTTAAGDTFIGRYAVTLAKWKVRETGEPFDIGSAIKAANEASALCVQRSGAMDSIPWGWES